MVLTVEPGLMSAELGAVRNSDTVLITEDGFEFFDQLPRDKIIIKKAEPDRPASAGGGPELDAGARERHKKGAVIS